MANNHDPKVRASAMALLLGGMPVAEVARKVNVPERTVFDWQRHLQGNPDMENAAAWLPQKTQSIKDEFVALIHDELHSLRVLTAYLTRPDVLDRAEYSDVAAAHGTLSDRLTRVADVYGGLQDPTRDTSELPSANVPDDGSAGPADVYEGSVEGAGAGASDAGELAPARDSGPLGSGLAW